MSDGVLGIAVGVMILNNQNQVLLGLREYGGEMCWSMPGGKMEFGENLITAATRETKEECNLEVINLKQVSVSENFHTSKNIQFVTIGYVTRNYSGTCSNNEPDVFQEWQWFDLDSVPENIFEPSRDILQKYLTD